MEKENSLLNLSIKANLKVVHGAALNLDFFLICSGRITAAQCLNHAWMQNSHQVQIDTKKLKSYVAKKRWMKGVNAMIAIRRMQSNEPYEDESSDN